MGTATTGVQIVVTANAAQAAGELGKFTAQTAVSMNAATAAAVNLNRATAVVNAGNVSLTSATKTTTAGLHALGRVASVIGFQFMPNMTSSVMMGAGAIKDLSKAAAAASISVGAMSVALAGLAIAGATANEWWKFAAARLGEEKTATKTAEANERLADSILKVGKARLAAGMLSDGEFGQLQTGVNAARGLPTNEAANDALVEIMSDMVQSNTSMAALDAKLKDTREAMAEMEIQAQFRAANGGDPKLRLNDIKVEMDALTRIGAAETEAFEKGAMSRDDWTKRAHDNIREEIRLIRERRDIETEEQEKLRAMREVQLTGTQTMFGNMALAAKAFGREGLVAYKTFAIAEATINTYKAAIGAYSSVVGIPFIGPALAPVAAAAAIAAGAAQVAAINATGFIAGGYTGTGSDTDVAGVVHKNEWVIPADSVRAWGAPAMAQIQRGPATATAGAGGSRTINQNLHVHFDKQAMLDAMRDDMEAIAVDAQRRNKHRFNA